MSSSSPSNECDSGLSPDRENMGAPPSIDPPPFALMTDGEKSEVASCLQQWGCCVWCSLRFVGDLDHEHYKADLSEMVERYKLNDPENGKICITCLGILHTPQADAIAEKCEEKLSDQKREFDSFIIVMRLPVALIPREHAILLLLREKYPKWYTNVTKDKIMAVKAVWKMRFADVLGELLDRPCTSVSQFEIRLQFSDEAEKECNFLKTVSASMKMRKTNPKRGEQFHHSNFNQNNVAKALSDIPDDVFKHYYLCPPRTPAVACVCKAVDFFHHSIFIAGRYNKYTRAFGQTPWFVDSVQKIESSVAEVIADVLLTKVKAMDHKFMASGREDVDVRMLGRGRPFMIEFINPKFVNFTQEQITSFQKEINENEFVKVRDLQLVGKQDGAILKEGEVEKSKNYSALIWCKDKVDAEKLEYISKLKDLKLDQLTPIRVLHRRSHSVREKMIYSLSCTRIDDHHFQLSLSTQAGTYIKEFVHGDFGRTSPNLCSLLGSDCDILALDVEDVILDWPKPIDANDSPVI